MASVAGLGTVTVGLAATAVTSRERPGTEVAEVSLSCRAPRCTRIVDIGGRHPVESQTGFSSRGGAVCYLADNISK